LQKTAASVRATGSASRVTPHNIHTIRIVNTS